MIQSHYSAGSGAVLVETREEARFLRSLLAELPQAEIVAIAAPGGPLRDARTTKAIGKVGAGLDEAYKWLSDGPGRVLVVWDWHCLVNSPGQWRKLIEALPLIRQPKVTDENSFGSLAVFVGPVWDLAPANPLRGTIPIIHFDLPTRKDLREMAESIGKEGFPLNGHTEAVADALCGLTDEAAKQAAAEGLVACGEWNPTHLRASQRRILRDAKLEVRPGIKADQYGGMGQLRSDLTARVIPWIRDPSLSVRRMLWAGVHGTGKTMGAQLLAGMAAEASSGNPEDGLVIILSLPRLKGGIVGQSEGQLTAALSCISAISRESSCVVVIDEVDAIPKSGLDGGASSGMWTILGEHLQADQGQAIYIGTTNRYDLLDTALTQRFGRGYFFDLPCAREREQIAEIHYRRCGLSGELAHAAKVTAELTEGYSARELGELICPDVVAIGGRDSRPTSESVKAIVGRYSPTSVTQADQLAAVRKCKGMLLPANDAAVDVPASGGRRIKGK